MLLSVIPLIIAGAAIALVIFKIVELVRAAR